MPDKNYEDLKKQIEKNTEVLQEIQSTLRGSKVAGKILLWSLGILAALGGIWKTFGGYINGG